MKRDHRAEACHVDVDGVAPTARGSGDAMRLAGDKLRQLHEALLDAFDRDSLTLMVRVHLGERLDHIASGGAFGQVVFALIEWAERRGEIGSLLRGAVRDNPGNAKLRTLMASTEESDGVCLAQVRAWGRPARMTVLETDLVGYSSIARALEARSGAMAIAALNAEIQRLVDFGLDAVGLSRRDSVGATTGDGAILVLGGAEEAHRFAAALHDAARRQSAGQGDAGIRRFRSGAATGDVVLERRGDGFDMAGLTIANAVRLEAAGAPGTLVVDVPTYDALPAPLRILYQPEEVIHGKRDEVLAAHRCVMDPQAAAEVPPSPPLMLTPQRPGLESALPTPEDVSRLLADVVPPAALDVLMYLLEMPLPARPSATSSIEERRNTILRWAGSRGGPGLSELALEATRLASWRV